MNFFGKTEWKENPNARGGPTGYGGYEGMERFAQSITPSLSKKIAKKILRQLSEGDYSKIAGTMLSPIHDRFATNLREALRAGQMGGNALAFRDQPALRAALDDQTRADMALNEGLAYGQAIPQLWGEASGIFGSERQNEINSVQQALDSALRARLASGQFVNKPGILDRIGQVVGIGGQIAGMAAGIPGLSGPFSKGGSGGGGDYFQNPSSPWYVPRT